ncbi:MAG: tyrosine-protein phosphatase [Pseudochelatococcus sp.]|jgi:protein-tyrosine phosphatase|uniref:tyrosine-protein phosphatase n=1 Tax=Pseudochelatococcus sp. TaxID=2020869 RepID=UPI003D919E62
MIDLHCHLLPGIDDGANDVGISVEMARMASADGVRTIACTPHIVPGLYNNEAEGITREVEALRRALDEAGVALELVVGADVHVDPELVVRLKAGVVPTIGGSRYFLLEPPHHVLPPNFIQFCRRLIEAGYIPVLTHPERLTWVEAHYDVIEAVNAEGVLLQITAGSLMGSFGRSAQYYAERLLSEERVDLIASDAHNVSSRPPTLSVAYAEVERRCGAAEAERLFTVVPSQILKNEVLAPRANTAVRREKQPQRDAGFSASLFSHWGSKKSSRRARRVELT